MYKDLNKTFPIIKSGTGVILKDINDKEYIDFSLNYGSLILGYCNEDVVNSINNTSKDLISFKGNSILKKNISEFICDNIPNVEMIEIKNDVSEAISEVEDFARRYTGKNKIIKFSGCSFESLDVIKGKFNDERYISSLFNKYGDDVAAVIIEPIASCDGVIKADYNFIRIIKTLCNKFKSLLIYNESLSGFICDFRGAQSIYNISPDVTIYGNILGGGMNAGFLCFSRELSNKIKLGKKECYNNELALSAGLTTIKMLFDHPDYYKHIERIGNRFEKGINDLSIKYSFPMKLSRAFGIIGVYFVKDDVNNYDDIENCDKDRYKRYYDFMINKGFYVPENYKEPIFLSTEHNITHVFKYIKALEEFIKIEINNEESCNER